MSKRIGILTLTGYFNYGNRLQNYAVQEIARKYGFDTTTIDVYPTIKSLFVPAKNICRILLGKIQGKRYMKLFCFSWRYIHTQVFIRKDMKLSPEIAKKYDYFFVGSDQVWNPFFHQTERDNLFLRFADKKQRICISPSFGVSKIDEEFKQDFIDGLNGFPYLCSREKEGAEIIKSLTGREAEVLIDPTLALNKNEWSKIFVPVKETNGSYIILAMLGSISEDKKQYLQDISQKNGFRIIDIFGKNNAFSPDEVLTLISKAKLVFTDSFHFSAFSINFNVPFIVTKREESKVFSNMYSRITSLLSMCGLEKRAYENITEQELFICDFSYANKALEEKRKKFYQYIEKCIGLSKE